MRQALALAVLLALVPVACHTTTGKVVLTPVTVVRDVVDAPLVSITNLFEDWADASNPPRPNVGVGVGPGGVNPNFGINLGSALWTPLSWIFGAVDYVIGRSIWPNFPNGLSPWRGEGETWGSLFFPSTKTLWADEPVDDDASTESDAAR